MTVAKLRLADFMKERREEMGNDSAVKTGKLSVADAVAIFRQRLDGQQDIKEGAKVYRRKCLEALLRSWPELAEKPVGKVSKDECHAWASRFAPTASCYGSCHGKR
jgi:hypothetical protein